MSHELIIAARRQCEALRVTIRESQRLRAELNTLRERLRQEIEKPAQQRASIHWPSTLPSERLALSTETVAPLPSSD